MEKNLGRCWTIQALEKASYVSFKSIMGLTQLRTIKVKEMLLKNIKTSSVWPKWMNSASQLITPSSLILCEEVIWQSD